MKMDIFVFHIMSQIGFLELVRWILTKQDIHPDYHEVEVVCVCGSKFKTKSTIKGDTIRIDVCDKCHPFYSGKQKLVDTAGRVEKFKKKHNLD